VTSQRSVLVAGRICSADGPSVLVDVRVFVNVLHNGVLLVLLWLLVAVHLRSGLRVDLRLLVAGLGVLVGWDRVGGIVGG